MIEYNSKEWKILINRLKQSKVKSNRDYLCIKCWSIVRYSSIKNHEQSHPSHKADVLSSKYFTSEDNFITLAREMG